jgi:hypothetical protein
LVCWRERFIEKGCKPTDQLADQLEVVCLQMLVKFDSLLTVATFEWEDVGSS